MSGSPLNLGRRLAGRREVLAGRGPDHASTEVLPAIKWIPADPTQAGGLRPWLVIHGELCRQIVGVVASFAVGRRPISWSAGEVIHTSAGAPSAHGSASKTEDRRRPGRGTCPRVRASGSPAVASEPAVQEWGWCRVWGAMQVALGGAMAGHVARRMRATSAIAATILVAAGFDIAIRSSIITFKNGVRGYSARGNKLIHT